ncbi:MAG TPA: aminoglycoside phosphotransferase family protein [Gaiellaceae bacterium]|nr:aminoglycoside phosphotransferase family protein [Gaiellaceae bacterium]
MSLDLSEARAAAEAVAREWGVTLGEPFALGRYSFVAPAGDELVLKAPWADDDESLHEAEALALWDGDGAVRLLRYDRRRRVLLEERALPGSDISDLGDDEAIEIALVLGAKLWRPAGAPFRRVRDQLERWLAADVSPLTPLARELLATLEPRDEVLVHGDFHHQNVLRDAGGFVAIDPKPYLAEREYDVYPWLHNPLPYRMTKERTERRIERFVAGGLDDYRIRAWAIIRGAYLTDDPDEQAILRRLVD